MKNILCYGDSNTHGFCAEQGGLRFPRDIRWPGRLARLLGDDYYVIEEGLNARTSHLDDPMDFDEYLNGRRTLRAILTTHIPLDLVVIMLGSNDLKTRFHLDAGTLARALVSLGTLAQTITAERNPDGRPAEVLLVSPIHIGPGMLTTSEAKWEFNETSIEVSKTLAAPLREFALAAGFHFFDAATVAEPSPVDSLHIMEAGHLALADALAAKVRDILG